MIFHFVALEGTAPLARTTSLSSCAGYHTPIEDEVAGEGTSNTASDLGQVASCGGSTSNAQVHLDIRIVKRCQYLFFLVNQFKAV